MPATKERTYNEAEIAERLKELPGWYYEDGWIRRVLQDRRLAHHADAGERGRLPGRGRVSPPRPDGHLGPAHR